jgi:hypothetical protein
LLAKDCVSPRLAIVPTFTDETEEDWPQVALIGLGEPFACAAEWLAWTRSSSNWSVCWPSCELETKGPSADPSEEMTLRMSAQVPRRHFGN